MNSWSTRSAWPNLARSTRTSRSRGRSWKSAPWTWRPQWDSGTTSDTFLVPYLHQRVCSQYNILTMQDQCVYSRSVLGRMLSTLTASPNSEAISHSQTQPNAISPGLVMMLAGLIVLLLLSLRSTRKTPQSTLA